MVIVALSSRHALRNSEIPSCPWKPRHRSSSFETLFPLVLWYARCYSPTPCEALCEELHYVSRTGHSAPSPLFYLGCTDLVWCAPHEDYLPPSVCVCTHTRKVAHVCTHSKVYPLIRAVSGDGGGSVGAVVTQLAAASCTDKLSHKEPTVRLLQYFY